MSTRGDTRIDKKDGEEYLTLQGWLKRDADDKAEEIRTRKTRSVARHKRTAEGAEVIFFLMLLGVAISFLRSCIKGGQIKGIEKIQEIHPPFKSLEAKTEAVGKFTENDGLMAMIINGHSCPNEEGLKDVQRLIATLQAPIQGQPPLNLEENVDEAKRVEDFRLNSVGPEGIRRSSISRKSARGKSARGKSASRKSVSRKSASRKFKSI